MADFSSPDLNLTEPAQGFAGYASPGVPNVSTPPSSYASDAMMASMGLSAVGSILTAVSQSRAAKAQGDYEQSIANTNATIAAIQSKQAIEAGDFAASKKDVQTQQAVGSERAAQGASGIDVASGSSALVRNATEGAGAQDELTIRNNAARQAWGYQTESIEDTYKGQFAQLMAKASSEQSLMTGGLQAISGPLSIESAYLRWSRYMGGGSGGSNGGLPYAVNN